MDLQPNQVSQIAKHLGHTIEVHHSYYRKHDEMIEKAKVSKLLYLSEHGKLHQFVSFLN